MKEIVKINLGNKMDLMVAHKRAMKLADLLGLSLSVQTIFATAVSEIARTGIENGKNAYLILGVQLVKGPNKCIAAIIGDVSEFCHPRSEAVAYADRLIKDVQVVTTPLETQVILQHRIPASVNVTDARLQSFIEYFEKELPISPYDELRRKNAQLQELAARLRESENNYRQLTDTLPLMMFTVSTSGKVLYTNKWLTDFLGGSPAQFQYSMAQNFVHPEDYPALAEEWSHSQERLSQLHGQVRLKRNGSDAYLWHMITVLPSRNEEGETEFWMGFIVDIHAQKLVEQTLKDNHELRATQQKLERYQHELEDKIHQLNSSNDKLEQFAYAASHDLQEPLRKIQTFADILQKNSLDPETASRYFEKITSSARRMAALIKNVLEYARTSADNEQFETVDLNEVLENVKTDFELMISQKQAVVHQSELPVIRGIPLQLNQLFTNLMGNALKFSGVEPFIEVSSRLLQPDEIKQRPELNPQNRYVEISFRDNGIGFEQEYAEQIFIIFKRLNDRQSYNGTGIGLALCKKIVENHKGVIKAFAEPGQGATFRIALPVG
jgi:PAS domain S-box-containing protein